MKLRKYKGLLAGSGVMVKQANTQLKKWISICMSLWMDGWSTILISVLMLSCNIPVNLSVKSSMTWANSLWVVTFSTVGIFNFFFPYNSWFLKLPATLGKPTQKKKSIKQKFKLTALLIYFIKPQKVLTIAYVHLPCVYSLCQHTYTLVADFFEIGTLTLSSSDLWHFMMLDA